MKAGLAVGGAPPPHPSSPLQPVVSHVGFRGLCNAAHLDPVKQSLARGADDTATTLVRRRSGIRGPALRLLSQAEEARLAHMIEAGLAAKAALDGSNIKVDATEAELEQIEADGRRAWERVLLSNLRLVWSVAGPEARRSGQREEDLFQEGVWAMAQALKSFNPEAGRFTTHAYRRVRRHVVAIAANRDGALGLTADQAITLRQAKAIEERLEAELGHRAPVDEVARQLGRSSRWTAQLLARRAPVLTGDYGGDRVSMAMRRPAEGGDPGLVEDIQRLPRKQRQVLALRYGFTDGRPRSWGDVSKDMGISISDARRTCKAALSTLRTSQARDGEAVRESGRAAASSHLSGTRTDLPEIDRLSAKGLSLFEVAIAMKTEPEAVYEACRTGRRHDLLARLAQRELRMTGPQPAGTNVLADAIRRAAAARGQGSDRPRRGRATNGSRRHVEPAVLWPRSSSAPATPGL